MRLRVALLGAALALGTAQAKAQTPAAPAAVPAPPRQDAGAEAAELARRHFKAGVKLYQRAKYAAALAEFEAAYAAKPGPGPLQNIALCQKALYRYGEAADSLGELLRRHEAELSAGERSAVLQAKTELEGLVGALRLRVKPDTAQVTLDGKPLSSTERLSAIRVNAGEHAVQAEATGYAPITQTVRVASKQEVALDLTLEAVAGFLEVRAGDPSAAIAIDGKPLALGQWQGPVSFGDEHLVQVYREGFRPFERRVRVARGQSLVVQGELRPAAQGEQTLSPSSVPGALPSPPARAAQLGWYAQGTLALYATNAKPFDFDLSNATSAAGGLGGKLGYRIWPTLAVEGFLELGQLAVEGACDDSSPSVAESGRTCDDPDRVVRDYEIGWFRLGPIFRLTTPGERWRFGGGIGAGFLYHRFHLGASEDGDFGEARTGGADPYFLLELGGAANWGHVIFGLDFVAILDGTRGLNAGNESAFEESGRTLAFAGLGLRVGWSEWRGR